MQDFKAYCKEFFKASFVQIYRKLYNILGFFIKDDKYDVVIISKHNNNVINYLREFPQESLGIITSNKAFDKYVSKNKQVKKKLWYSEYGLVSMVNQIIMLLQTSKVVIDDYYAPLFALDKSKEVWNIWHSYAIYKKIGLQSPYYAHKGQLTLSRYKRNYKRIDKLFVRSEKEKQIFIESYYISPTKIFVEPKFYYSQYADIVPKKKEKLIIYAPTFRTYSYNFEKVYWQLKEMFPDYLVVAHFHPRTLKENPHLEYIQSKKSLGELLAIAEVFISDYSGLLIELADLYSSVTVYQIIDEQDFLQYKEINGINADAYEKKYKELKLK